MTTPPEPTAPADPAAPAGDNRFFSQADLDKAIAEALAKANPSPAVPKTDPRFQEMTAELRELRAAQKKAEKAEEQRQAQIEAANKAAEEAKMTAEQLMTRRQEEMQQQLAQMQAEQQSQLAVMAKEVEFQRLSAHVQRRINEESDNIAPELLQFVTGSTVEEIEASIEQVKASTASIVENMRQAGTRQRAAMPGVAPAAGTNGVGPMDQQGQRQYSDEDIKNMGMGEYAALRSRLGFTGANNQGLFRA